MSNSYKSIAFRSSSGFVSDDNSFQDVTKLLEIFLHGLFLSLPSQPSNKHLRVCRVTKLPRQVHWSHLPSFLYRSQTFNQIKKHSDRSLSSTLSAASYGKTFQCYFLSNKESINRSRLKMSGGMVLMRRTEEGEEERKLGQRLIKKTK